MSSNQSPTAQPPREAGTVIHVPISAGELQKLRDTVSDAYDLIVRMGPGLVKLDKFLKAAEAEAAREHSEYLPAAHNGREGELMSEGDCSSSLVRGHVNDLVGRNVDVTG